MADSSVGSVWAMAVKKQRARRALGAQAGLRRMTEGTYLAQLQRLGTILLSSLPQPKSTDDNARANFKTVVTGYWSYDGNGSELPLLFAVMKLADTSVDVQSQLLLEGRNLKLIDSPNQLIFIDDVPTNLHAEMAIVQYLCTHGYQKQHLAGLLEIYCCGKGVCQDCSGWLTKHGVAHAPLSGAPSPTGWKNPLTGALYKASEDNLVYTKGLKEMSVFNRDFGGPYQGNVKL